MRTRSVLVLSCLLFLTIGAQTSSGWTKVSSTTSSESGRTAVAARAASPSGVPIPTGSPRGWRRVFADNFNGSRDRCWGKYNGVPSSSPTAMWRPSHVVFTHGMAELRTYRQGGQWVSGGMASNRCLTRAYGMYKIRFKISRGSGVKYAILMWPAHESWPCGGEIDWGEDAGGDRARTFLTNIYCGAGGRALQLPQRRINGNFARWNTLTVTWSPDHLVEHLNGRLAARITSPTVPSDPMFMAVQMETNTDCALRFYSCINGSTPSEVQMDVDWVVAYART